MPKEENRNMKIPEGLTQENSRPINLQEIFAAYGQIEFENKILRGELQNAAQEKQTLINEINAKQKEIDELKGNKKPKKK